jgi:dipeptidyl aminopeptidase/acylaminoacyl peptidase
VTAVREQRFQLENEVGFPIRCDLRLPPGEGPFPVVVILHGFKGFKDWGMFPPTGRALAEAGVATVALNASMNGVGEDLEEFTELDRFAWNTPRREVLDVGFVIEAISRTEVDSSLDVNRLGVLGHSRGGAVVTLVASRDPRVKCVVTWSTIASFLRYTDRALEEWRRSGRLEVPNQRTGQTMWLEREVLEDLEANAEEYDLEAACRRITAPFLVVHGELDEAVDTEDARKLHAWAGAEDKELVIVPKTGHTFGAAHPWQGPTPAWETAVTATSKWFSRWLAAD